MDEPTHTDQYAEQKSGSAGGAESPTTAHPLDFDEPQDSASTAQEGGNLASPPVEQQQAPRKVSFQDEATETPPPKPPRPMSPQAQAEATLVEAFPGIDAKVVKAVLVASNGQVEPAFNALLSMSDPSFQEEGVPPPQPPRPSQAQRQMEADERYARQLAAHYQSASGHEGYGSQSRGDPPLPQPRKETGLKPNELYDDREHSFFDDDLPVIRENVRKGFLETQSKVNKWIMDFKKRIDGEDEDDDLVQPQGSVQPQGFAPGRPDHMQGMRRSAEARRSSDRERYDADPRVLGDDFTALELRDDEAPPQQRTNRPIANPDLFKPTPTAPQSGPVDEVDALYRAPTPTQKSKSGAEQGKTKKWQPLTSVAPNPEGDDNDPFSLGDSDDDEAKAKDIKADDSERLKRAASKSEPSGDAKLEPQQRSGSMATKDKEAEEMLTGKKE
ncbi:hypothetical protein BDY21DRAFT_339409 [Lineolata rhizophorae]|uniref:CUE domain-containing protein n=1 Tax=Lineolata rhizophorae TaxID=578093 RepID=A0A6A6P5A1_9PEZI|nr:hypothetical protein BDY21DRAFT_339409 [Lineolata rhizophorae]